MGRMAGRSGTETRSALLRSAAEAIRSRGPSASLEDIAKHAGITKSGLIYHFASKDALIIELIESLLERLHADVERCVDRGDDQPGRLTRGYIRAMLAPSSDQAAARETLALLVQLMTIPAVRDIARADAEKMEAKLRSDGLPDDVLTLVISSTDGAHSAPLWGGSARTDHIRDLERRLIQLTYQPELWHNQPWKST
jgi:AcrR family transcriptional regulator